MVCQANPINCLFPWARPGQRALTHYGTWLRSEVWLSLGLGIPKHKLRVLLKSGPGPHPEAKGLQVAHHCHKSFATNRSSFYQFLVLTVRTLSPSLSKIYSPKLASLSLKYPVVQLRERCFWSSHDFSEKIRHHYFWIWMWWPHRSAYGWIRGIQSMLSWGTQVPLLWC